MRLSDFHYDLPEELIAQTPAQRRDSSRLMRLDRANGAISHHHFFDLPSLLHGNELLVYNDTRVFPARMWATKESGGRVELLVLRFLAHDLVEAMTRCSKPLRPGTTISAQKNATPLEIVEVPRPGRAIVRFPAPGAKHWIHLEGVTPLPPYIKRRPDEDRPDDQERYQTIFAKEEGSVAAPTAGLHFTPDVLARLEAKGIQRVPVTLHVGPGTFEPIRSDLVDQHKMEVEHYLIPDETIQAIQTAKSQGRPVIAVGTTTTRCLEGAARKPGGLAPGPGFSDIFLYPGCSFEVIDGLITNFHLPESTLMMLVSALAGRESILKAYGCAVANRYRFYSYGDCMLIR